MQLKNKNFFMTKDPAFFLATTNIILNVIFLYTLTGVSFYILFGGIFKNLFGIQFPILGTRNGKILYIFAILNFFCVSMPELAAGLDAGEAAVTSIDSTFLRIRISWVLVMRGLVIMNPLKLLALTLRPQN